MKNLFNFFTNWIPSKIKDYYILCPYKDLEAELLEKREVYSKQQELSTLLSTEFLRAGNYKKRWQAMSKISTPCYIIGFVVLAFSIFITLLTMLQYYWFDINNVQLMFTFLCITIAMFMLGWMIKVINPKKIVQIYSDFEMELIQLKKLKPEVVYGNLDKNQTLSFTGAMKYDGDLSDLIRLFYANFTQIDQRRLNNLIFNNIANKDGAQYKSGTLDTTISEIKKEVS